MSKPSGLALAVLALLYEEPMYPYRMQQLITSRGKSTSVNVTQRASLYSTIDRLNRDGLIELEQVSRDGQRPERSVYKITQTGRDAGREWLGDMLANPKPEYPEFGAALAQVPMIEMAEAIELLEHRQTIVEASVEELQRKLDGMRGRLPDVVLLDKYLSLRQQRTELDFIKEAVTSIRSGTMTWSRESLAYLSAATDPTHQDF